MSTLICSDRLRRKRVRQHQELNGLDYLEVGSDQRTLTVYFLGKMPVDLQPANVIIEGGRRIRDLQVETVDVVRDEAAESDSYMEVTVNKAGDFSTYTLRVVEGKNENGEWIRHPSFDARYDRVEFSFKVDCPSDLDCRQEVICPPVRREEPEINYLAKDYASFRQLILDRLALVMPDWKERHVPDLGITLVELLAYAGDHLSYYQDAIATEAYLDTARQRISVRRHARLVDYPMHEGCNARTWVCVETGSNLTLDPKDVYFITAQEGIAPVVSEQELQRQVTGGYEVFEPVFKTEIRLYAGHHEILFYTWGDQECCLPKGATTATLTGLLVKDPNQDNELPRCVPNTRIKDTEKPSSELAASVADGISGLHLKPGDVLIFEEVIGPKTGNPVDADPVRRHAVRLVDVQPGHDPLDPDTPITEITWDEEDALPFPFCLSSRGSAPNCEMIENISVARGNVILVDHGKTIDEPFDEEVKAKESVEACDCLGKATETVLIPETFRPILKKNPVTFCQPVEPGMAAIHMLRQDARQALPQIWLTGTTPDGDFEWTVQRDLLVSGSTDCHFVAETDNEGYAHLRFGNGELGKQPAAGTRFAAKYRLGTGTAGNVGADVIHHLVTRKTTLSSAAITVRNPLAATGGTVPEPLAEVRLFAPHALRKRLERAITPADYANIVMREFPDRVQRAVASLRWNGNGYGVLVAIDPFGREVADDALLKEIEDRLYRYRRIGHDLSVQSARPVPLKIALSVCILPGYFRGHVKAALLAVFSNRQLPDGRLGFFHPDNLSFGDGIYLSRIVATAQAVTGVASVVVEEFQRFHEPAADEIENGLLPLNPLEIARLDNDPSFPENGLLTLNIGGGR